MSHQTGIKSNKKLLDTFKKARNGKIRVIKVSIDNEELTSAAYSDMKSKFDWKKEFDHDIIPLVKNDSPCYILYKIGPSWLLINWIPENASVRQKMLYASTKATLKKEFGSADITEEVHCTEINEVSYEGYLKYKQTFVNAPNPLTSKEEEIELLKKTEIDTNIAVDTRTATCKGIDFPIDSKVDEALENYSLKRVTYIQFKINLDEERIELDKAGSTSSLGKEISKDHARYHLYLFKHSHDGVPINTNIFVYSIPSSSVCSIKERMLYSACKNNFIDHITQKFNLNIEKKIEVDESDDLSEEYLLNELYPPADLLARKQFAKPKGPPKRGAKRLTASQQPE